MGICFSGWGSWKKNERINFKIIGYFKVLGESVGCGAVFAEIGSN